MARTVSTMSQLYGPTVSAMMPTSVNTVAGASGGGGQPTPQTGVTSAVPITSVLSGLQGSIFAQPMTWLFGLVLFLVAWKLIEEHRGGEAAFQKIRVDGTNTVKVGSMALFFIILVKYFTKAYTVPGASDLIQAYG